jgi:hypothetical protein
MAVKSRRDGRWMDVVRMARRASKRRTQDQDKLAACCKPRAKIDYLYAKQAIRRIPHIHISPASSTKIWIVLAASGRQSLRYQASRAALRSVHIRCPSISQHTTSTAMTATRAAGVSMSEVTCCLPSDSSVLCHRRNSNSNFVPVQPHLRI